jgi:ketosteroid isomerase-like protein
MSEEENTRLVQQAYRDFQNGDIQDVLGALSEDVEWVTTQLSGVPVGGTYHGVEEAGQFFSSLGEAQEPRLFEPREFVAQGEKVVARNWRRCGKSARLDLVLARSGRNFQESVLALAAPAVRRRAPFGRIS